MQSRCSALFDNLTRKKSTGLELFLDSPLRRCLNAVDLTFLGMGTVIGAGLFVLTGDLFRNVAGPSVIISFVLVATSALLSSMCYAEFASRIPKVGSAYAYTYVAMGEVWAFIVGWNMVLEYILAAAILARACSEYINSVSNGVIFNSFTENFASLNSKWLGHFPDILALLLSIVATLILSLSLRKASICNMVATALALVSVIFFIGAGMMLVDRKSWTDNFASQGAMGVLRAAGSLFFVFVGLDAIAIASEEAIDPRKSVPLSLVTSYTLSLIVYSAAAVVLTLMTPYGNIGQFIPIAESFAQRGFGVGKYIVGTGGILATAGALILTTFAASRLVYSMATDGLLFQWLAHTNEERNNPMRTTLINGIVIGSLALLVNIRCMMELLSIGTLIAFTSVAVSVLLTRYETGVHSVTPQEEGAKGKTDRWLKQVCCVTSLAQSNYERLATGQETNDKQRGPDQASSFRARVAVCLLLVSITGLAILLTNVDMTEFSGKIAWELFLVGLFGLLIVFSLMVLERQPKNSATFPFMVPLVPYLPLAAIFINVFLLVTLHVLAYVRIGVWMSIGVVIYVFYGQWHSVEATRPTEAEEEQKIVLYHTPKINQRATRPQPD